MNNNQFFSDISQYIWRALKDLGILGKIYITISYDESQYSKEELLVCVKITAINGDVFITKERYNVVTQTISEFANIISANYKEYLFEKAVLKNYYRTKY